MAARSCLPSIPTLSFLINENIHDKCFRSSSSSVNLRISPDGSRGENGVINYFMLDGVYVYIIGGRSIVYK